MLTFRAASATDIPALRELADRIWRSSYAGVISAEQMDYMLARMYSEETIRRELVEGVLWELAQSEGTPIGFLSVTCDGDIAKLNKLYLLPEHQGRGLGQEMLARVCTLALDRGMRAVRLQVNKRNLRAQRAYERAGFTITESAVFEIGGGHVMDDFIMTRDVARVSSP